MYSMDYDDDEIMFYKKYGFELHTSEIEEVEKEVRNMIEGKRNVSIITIGEKSIEITIECAHCQNFKLRIVEPPKEYCPHCEQEIKTKRR